MAQGPAAAQQVDVVVVNGLADLLPDSYSGDDLSIDIKEFFGRYWQWLKIHQNRFVNNTERVDAVKYVLSGRAVQWFNDIPTANMSATVNDLQHDHFACLRLLKLGKNGKQNWKNVNMCHVPVPCHDKQVSIALWKIAVTSLSSNWKVRQDTSHELDNLLGGSIN